MQEFSAEAVWIETTLALETIEPAQSGRKYPAYIGLDVHNETNAVAVARSSWVGPESRGRDRQHTAVDHRFLVAVKRVPR